MLTTLQDPVLNQLPSLGHTFFGRMGGISGGYYTSLNCAYRILDDHPDCVRENRRRALDYLGFPLTSLATVQNEHGHRVIAVTPDTIQQNQVDADGLVTRYAGIVLGTVSADCPSILLSDPKAGVIGVAHAGWKGAKGGVLESVVQQMMVLGAKAQDIVAAISPAIAQASYEVSADYREHFLAESKENAHYFGVSNPEKPAHFLFDLVGYVRDRLLRLELQHVSTAVAVDTYRDERFFSCRRAYHQKQPAFGCQLSCLFQE
jgi:YfiH family protein